MSHAQLMADLLAPRPAWAIRSTGQYGKLVASCPPGIASTAEAALEWYVARYPRCPYPVESLRAFPREG